MKPSEKWPEEVLIFFQNLFLKVKELEIEKTKVTFIISVLKSIYWGVISRTLTHRSRTVPYLCHFMPQSLLLLFRNYLVKEKVTRFFNSIENLGYM